MTQGIDGWVHSAYGQEVAAAGRSVVFSFTISDTTTECLVGFFPNVEPPVLSTCYCGVYFAVGAAHAYFGGEQLSSPISASRRFHIVRVDIAGQTRAIFCEGDTPVTTQYGFDAPGTVVRDEIIESGGDMRLVAAFPRPHEQIEAYALIDLVFDVEGAAALSEMQVSGNALATDDAQGFFGLPGLGVSGVLDDTTEFLEITHGLVDLPRLGVAAFAVHSGVQGLQALPSPGVFGFTTDASDQAGGTVGLPALLANGFATAGVPSNRPYFSILLDNRAFVDYSFTDSDIMEWASAADYTEVAEGVILQDVARAAATLRTFWQTSEALTDVGAAVDTVRAVLVMALSDSAEASDETKLAYGVALLDALRGQDSTQTFYHALQSLADTLNAQDGVVTADVELLADEADAEDEALAFLHMLAIAADAAEAGDASLVFFRVDVHDAANATAQAQALRHLLASPEDAALAADAAALQLATNVADEGGAEDALNRDYHGLIAAQDVAEAGDEVTSLRHLIADVRDVGEAWVVFKLGQESYVGWAMNTDGAKPISEYQGYNFNSFAEIGGKYYGASDEGLYLLEGEDDAGAPIDASIKTMMIDFNTTRMKRVPSAYMGYTSSGRLVLRVSAVSMGELEEHWFEAVPRVAEVPREQMVRIGRGLRSRYWQFELVNVDGADFEIDKMEVYPVVLNRRV